MEEADVDDGLSPEEKLVSRFLEREGIDLRFCQTEFLEASDLGDATSLKQRLKDLPPDGRRDLVRQVDQAGLTGLLLAVRKGDEALARVLLDADANPNDVDFGGAAALHYAASRGSASLLTMLFDYKADVAVSDDRKETPLMWARGASAVAELLRARADVRARDVEGKTALMLASVRGDREGVRALAAVPGIDLDAQDAGGRSAQAMALDVGHSEVAELLVSFGAAAMAAQPERAVRRAEALHAAARCGDAAGCAALLPPSGGAVPSAAAALDVDEEIGGETALLLAATAGREDAVEVLLRARADPNRADSFLRETPLIRAVLSHSSDRLLAMLLEARADASLRDLGGRTAGDVATAWGCQSSAELLAAASGGTVLPPPAAPAAPVEALAAEDPAEAGLSEMD